MPSRPLIVFDRSRTTTDWTCPRKRYLGYDYEGTGITSSSTSLELFLGSCVHDGLAAIASGANIDEVASKAGEAIYKSLTEEVYESDKKDIEVFALEQSSLCEGLLRGFYRSTWPNLMSTYPEIVAIEQEMIYPYNNLIFMSKPDLVVRDKEGNLFYIEYKTTSSKKDGWINSWDTAVQLHSSIKAIETTRGEKVTGVVVQGLYKGYESYGKQSSPFCYAYRREGQAPFSTTQTRYNYQAGFKRFPIWEVEGGVKKWVEEMPMDILMEQFPQTPPIYINEDLINNFFEQCSFREHEIDLAKSMLKLDSLDEEGKKMILDNTFPQRFDQCQPAWGRACGFRSICHGGIQDPLSAGYVLRTPHHKLEEEQFAKA